jgi:hypothetical protein
VRIDHHVILLLSSDDKSKLSFPSVEVRSKLLFVLPFIMSKELSVPAHENMMWENRKQDGNDMAAGNSESRMIEARTANLKELSICINRNKVDTPNSKKSRDWTRGTVTRTALDCISIIIIRRFAIDTKQWMPRKTLE